jgi:UDP-glucose 4-epimerase
MLANELAKQRHRIVLAAEDADKLKINLDNTIIHSINPTRDIFHDTMSAYRFDIVVFISTREEQLPKLANHNTGHQLDGLRNTLELSKQGSPKHFFYISSTEVYGYIQNGVESMQPVPASINGHSLMTGEEYCKYYQSEFGLNITILRLPYVYGPGEDQGLVYRLIQDCKSQNSVTIPGCPERECNFLHVNDVTDFLKRALDDEYSPSTLIVNLCSSVTFTNWQVAELLRKYFPNRDFCFDEEAKVFTGPATVSTAKAVFDWVDLYHLDTELEQHQELTDTTFISKKIDIQKLLGKLPDYAEMLKPMELILGALLTQYFSQLTGTLIQYKYVDFRLLFVVLMAAMYGLRYGLLAALLMSLSLIYTWSQLDIDWNLLLYNVGNWFPPILYIVTGLILGYNRDRNETIIDNEKNQTKLIYEKYQFLYEVFNEIRKLKDEFREQVIGYRDSFGKIYSITRELDTLQEQNVYLRALSILEELMENHSIAIYRLEPGLEYARLEVSSTSLHKSSAKSLKLSNYPEAVKSIGQGTIFQNTALLPDYPAYLAPIFNNSYPFNVPVAIIVIWSVDFERYSTYYYNLFKVICGLIQAALLRATKFLDANYERVYIPATRIFKPEAFNEILRTRMEMNKNKIATDQLIVVEKMGMSLEDLYFTVSEAIRIGDVVGLRSDDNCYILLSQADKLAAKQVMERLKTLGVCSRLVEDQGMQMENERWVYSATMPS